MVVLRRGPSSSTNPQEKHASPTLFTMDVTFVEPADRPTGAGATIRARPWQRRRRPPPRHWPRRGRPETGPGAPPPAGDVFIVVDSEGLQGEVPYDRGYLRLARNEGLLLPAAPASALAASASASASGSAAFLAAEAEAAAGYFAAIVVWQQEL